MFVGGLKAVGWPRHCSPIDFRAGGVVDSLWAVLATPGVVVVVWPEGRLLVNEAAAAAADRKCIWAAAAAANMLKLE